jgi:hypothetical protein
MKPATQPVTQGRGIKWRPKLTHIESQLLSAIPKAVLFVVARQLAAQLNGTCDDLGPSAVTRLCDEWMAQYLAGNVPQKVPAHLDTRKW